MKLLIISFLFTSGCISASYERAQQQAMLDAYVEGMRDGSLRSEPVVAPPPAPGCSLEQSAHEFVLGWSAGEQHAISNQNKQEGSDEVP